MAELAASPDHVARARISSDLEATVVVEAGAGSGKTTALVDRLVALVSGGEAELESIAAITFTEKAAAELRDRVRQRLEDEVASHAGSPVGDRCRHALVQLDRAPIGTLHAFAQRLLSEHPVEAGLPPRVEVLDEVTSGIEFDERWSLFRDELLSDSDLSRTLVLLQAAGVSDKAARTLAVAFDQNWDLVGERIPDRVEGPPPVLPLVKQALAPLDEVCGQRVHCRTDDDRLLSRLDELAAHAARLRATDDEADLLEALVVGGPSFKVGNRGQRKAWAVDIDEVRTDVAAVGQALEVVKGDVITACAHRLGVAIRGFTLAFAEARRRAGRLEFHDLLVVARALLRDAEHGPGVRDRLAGRYQRLLLDEFQDTDPIQIELAVRIAAVDPAGAGAGSWDEVAVRAGRLFVVGDPKQSIYRFRRADIATFLKAAERFGASGGTVRLSANFRTVEPVIAWVNHTFATLFALPVDQAMPLPSQPAYQALDATRPAPPDGPAVAVVGRSPHPGAPKAAEMRVFEAADVAATVARAVAEGWSVDDGASVGGAAGWRPARLGDITILVPARTSLPFLEDALEERGIPFRAEASSLVYATRVVRDLLMVVRAADDPTDHLRIVGALRTPLLGCGDDDLFRFRRQRQGHWSYLAQQPDGIPDDDPVGAGLRYLGQLHRERTWLSPAELLDRIARERRVFELAFAEGRPRDSWRRVRFVIDQARAWSEASGGTLRQYLSWVDRQAADGARVAEPVLPEPDHDAVRIMTIHAAKGLEFPITIVSGMSTAPQARPSPAEVVFPPDAPVGYRMGGTSTPEYTDWQPIDEQMALDERIRLLYVACTRARDHLVVSLHRKARAGAPPEAAKATNAELLVEGIGDRLADLSDAAGGSEGAGGPGPSEPRRAPVPARVAWENERTGALGRASSPTTVAATALTDEGAHDPTGEPDPGLQKRPRDLDLPPWLKGRYGTTLGRAVHGVLQTVDLATGAGLDAAVAAQCEAEALPDRAETVRALVVHALGSPTVAAAARLPHWREVYACTPTPDGRLLEGYIDLLYRTDDGLVVVDYKTAATTDPAELDRRVDGYRLQGASYALAVGATTGEKVERVTFIFLTPQGAVERHLDDLAATLVRLPDLLRAGREVLVD